MRMSEPLHTYCLCERCGATVRASRHSETDCETIKELRAKLAQIEDDLAWLARLDIAPSLWPEPDWEVCLGRDLSFFGSTPAAAIHAAREAYEKKEEKDDRA